MNWKEKMPGVSMCEFYNENYIKYGAHLGTMYPYFSKAVPHKQHMNFEQVLRAESERGFELVVDEVGLVQKSCLPYLLGNRTVLKNIERAPWVHSYRDGSWGLESLPLHGHCQPDPILFVNELKTKLIKEAKSYIGTTIKTIGILLSGGMDSRIVAGIIKQIQLEHSSLNVVGLTWGDRSSRDVVYSEKICKQFDWDFIHFPLTAETLYENIFLSAKMGAEVSALHYHAMNNVAKLKGLDVVLAGSYGDSVGRAEYSGKHLTKLSKLLPNELNRLGLIKSDIFERCKSEILKDVLIPVQLNYEESSIRHFEIEQESHYMRRMLQTCMHVIGSEIPFYQMFTSPDVFGLMWSLRADLRTDNWYTRLLRILPGNLLDIPWARTGVLYQSDGLKPDKYSQRYHQYGLWLRTDLKEYIINAIDSKTIRDLGIFNDISLDLIKFNWLRTKGAANNKLDELLVWLASLAHFLESCNNIKRFDSSEKPVFKDYKNSLSGFCHAFSYITIRNFLNK